MDFNDIKQEIQTNLPDNNTQLITAKRLRDTLTDLTDTIEEQQGEFETSATQTINNAINTMQDAFADMAEDVAAAAKVVDDLNINDLNRIVYHYQNLTWKTGGYYLSTGTSVVSGSGQYLEAIDISEYVGNYLVFSMNDYTSGSIRAIVIADENNNILASSTERDNTEAFYQWPYTEKLEIPENAKYAYVSVSIKATEKDLYIIKIASETPEPEPTEETQKDFYVDGTNGDDNNDATSGNPIKTFGKLRQIINGLTDVNVYIANGVYNETLYFDQVGHNANVTVIGDTSNDGVIISGGVYITGWTAVSGHTGVYSTPFTGTIDAWGQYNSGRGIIYEIGVGSKYIEDADRHPSQKGLTYRLPFTMIQQVIVSDLASGLTALDSASGWFIYNNVLYMKNSDASNPTQRQYAYTKRVALQCGDNINKLVVKNISFRYTKNIVFKSKYTERYNCSIFGSNADGFQDQTDFCRTYFDECAACGNDGANGHFNALTGWASQSLRTGGEMVEYYYAWCHDNGDDGLSHHEASHIRVIGGLYEYNGDGGIRMSNTGNAEVICATFQHNGQDRTSGASRGSGFDIVNDPLAGDTRKFSTSIVYNCVSRNNRYGYTVNAKDNLLKLVNCFSDTSDNYEFYADYGKIKATNCTYRQSDSTKIKNTNHNGSIDIITGTQLI